MARTPKINEDHIRKAVKYRPRRSYIVRDTMFLKGVSENTVNVRSYKAIIGVMHLQDGKVVEATIDLRRVVWLLSDNQPPPPVSS